MASFMVSMVETIRFPSEKALLLLLKLFKLSSTVKNKFICSVGVPFLFRIFLLPLHSFLRCQMY